MKDLTSTLKLMNHHMKSSWLLVTTKTMKMVIDNIENTTINLWKTTKISCHPNHLILIISKEVQLEETKKVYSVFSRRRSH